MAQQLGACTSWRVQQVTPEQVIQEKQPNNVLVTTVQDSKIELREPIGMVEDTLTGLLWTRDSRKGSLRKVPLDSVKTVAVREFDPLVTGLLIGVPAAFLLVAAIAYSQEWDWGSGGG